MQSLRSFYDSLETSTWVTIAVTVFGLAVAHAMMSWYIRYTSRNGNALDKPSADFTLRLWLRRGALRSIRPLAMLIWVNGLHFVAVTLLGGLNEYDIPAQVPGAIEWLRGMGTVIALTWLLIRISVTIDEALRAEIPQSGNDWAAILVPFAGRAVRWVLPLMAIMLGIPALAVSARTESIVQHAVSLLLIATIAFLVLQLIKVGADLVLQKQQLSASDNRHARAIYTQVTMLRKLVVSVVILIAIASMLMVFEPVRHFGTAIIASAGVAGIILGFAAQKSIATLLAGFQIALTQPIRIDDVVIVEGEWGVIEEITLTYVVVRIWDLRRLVLPISYFIEKPFQNWTRTSADLLGSVFLYVDYTVPLESLRAELKKILEASALWDKKVSVLQVTDTKQHTIELRVLVSARNAGQAFDLRCEVREKLIAYLQRNHPESLPRLRTTLQESAASDVASMNRAWDPVNS